MKQYGDITQLSGYDLDPVDLIVGGSPCQDLSVAGKRAGLDGERSGLFMEMIRIIREMKEKTDGVYPRYALWENVPGAFSSNSGADFSAVLGEFARLIEPNAPDVPMPEAGWAKSGILLVGNGSLAWRTHDAQFWGVPQRRRRVSLVADLRGQSAYEILFERKGLSGDTQTSGEAGQGIAGETADRVGEASEVKVYDAYQHHGWRESNSINPVTTGNMNTVRGDTPLAVEPAISFQERCGKPGGEKGILIQEDHVGALSTLNNQMVFDSQVYHGCKEFTDGISQTVNAQYGTGGNNQPLVVNDVFAMQRSDEYKESTQAHTVSARDYKSATDLVYTQTSFGGYENKVGTLRASGGDNEGGSENLVTNNLVRRLTPLEYERLQGYPDGWTNIPSASDSAKYKALGNSIALPFWEHLAHRFADTGGVKTIGSLFDGIGGFPLVFKRAGAETLWTSEIDSFCQKVVEYHIAKGDL